MFSDGRPFALGAEASAVDLSAYHVIRNPADWIGEAGFPVLSWSW
jgi:hypothetical protein